MACEKITISNFLHEKSVLIIGAKDAIIDSLIEKIVNHCNVWHVYVVFHCPERDDDDDTADMGRNKVIFMRGNLSQHNLGLNYDDVKLLKENVSFVIHTGVTDYKATLIEAIKVNLLGTSEVVNLCCQIKNLKGLVHVSTAFNCSDDAITEKIIYQPAISPEILIEYSNWMNDHQLKNILKKFQISLNGFVLTKNMSEELIEANNNGFPVAIIRPSIIAELCGNFLPVIENVVVLDEVLAPVSSDKVNFTVDLVPANGLVNLVLASSWHLVAYRPNLPNVYDCTGGTSLLVKFVKSRKIYLYEKWKSVVGINDSATLYEPYLKEVFKHENYDKKHLEQIMNEEDRHNFNIDMSKTPCKFIKRINPSQRSLFLLKRCNLLFNVFLFLVWKKWILKSTPASHVFFASVMLTYGLFKAGKGLKKIPKLF